MNNNSLHKKEYRLAAATDIKQIQIVRNAVKENRLSNPGSITDEMCLEYIANKGRGWVCEIHNQVVGFSILDLTKNNVWALFVHPDYSQQGIGRQLHNRMLDWYFDQSSVDLWLGTDPNTRAETFYRKSGWKENGVHGDGEIKFEMKQKDWKNLQAIDK